MKKAIYVLVVVILLVGVVNLVKAQNYDDRADLINSFLEFMDRDGDGRLAGLGSYRPNIAARIMLSNLGGTATSSNAAARTFHVADSRHIAFQLQTTSTPSMTIKIKCSLLDTVGNFDNTTSTGSDAGNSEISSDFVELIDTEDRSSFDGDTGIVITTAETRLFEMNNNGCNYIYATTTSYTSGSSTLWFKSFTNQ